MEAMPTDEKDEGNAGNSNGGNNRHTVFINLFSGPYQQVSSSSSSSNSNSNGRTLLSACPSSKFTRNTCLVSCFSVFALAVNFFTKHTNQLKKKPMKWMRRTCLK